MRLLLHFLFGRSPTPGPAWTTSEAGNPTTVIGPNRVTVYPDGHVWKFCVADSDDRRPPYFSDGYGTPEMAREEAMAFIRGTPSIHQSSRQIREDKREAALPDRITREKEQLAAITKSVLRAENAASPKPSTLANLAKRINTRRGIANGLWIDAHAGPRRDLKRAADTLRNGYIDLEGRVANVLGSRGDP